MANNHYQVLIIGGGAAGITVAASLRRKPGGRDLNIAIVEPSEDHYYQPAFTLVGAGVLSLDSTRRKTVNLIPNGVNWIKDRCAAIDPQNNAIQLDSGHKLHYDYLVVCSGIELDWSKIDGLSTTLSANGVCSNYSPHRVEYTWQCIQGLKSGAMALFTQPPLPFKCPGAPQKIVYLTADYLKKHGLRESVTVSFNLHGPVIFGVPYFAERLREIIKRYDIECNYQKNLIAVNGAAREAEFEYVSDERKGQRETVKFDMLHVTPYQSPATFIKESALANDSGYVDIDQSSMRSTKFDNVYALGDVGSSPNSKTAAAVRKQAPVVVRNLLATMRGETGNATYDGYGSCPLTTAYGKTMIAEFIYGGKVTPSLPLNPGKEYSSYWWIKKTGLPLMYWHYMLKGHEVFPKHNTNFVE